MPSRFFTSDTSGKIPSAKPVKSRNESVLRLRAPFGELREQAGLSQRELADENWNNTIGHQPPGRLRL